MNSFHCFLACGLAFLLQAKVCLQAQKLVPSPGVEESRDKSLGFLGDHRPGYWLAATNDLGVWWCESGWKIGRARGLPEIPRDGQAKSVSVSAARGEYEPVQVILRPEKDGELLSATATLLRTERDDAAAIEVRLDEVAYVNGVQDKFVRLSDFLALSH